MKIIAHIKTDFKEKFGIPRQSGLVENLSGKIIFEKEYQNSEALRGLEEFSHVWILWQFSKAVRDKWSPTVRPPLLGGNKRVGVFATRSPFRPNPIGLSCVKLDKIEIEKENGPVIYVSGIDMLDGTPVYDIKPYLPYADSKPQALGGFTETLSERKLNVSTLDLRFYELDKGLQKQITDILSNDPRPSYKDDDFEYGMKFKEFEIKFTVKEKNLTILSIEDIKS